MLMPRQLNRVVPTYKHADVTDAISEGKRFIPVDGVISMLPSGYQLIDVRRNGESMQVLVPSTLLAIIADPNEAGEGALDELAEFYKDVSEFEDSHMLDGTNIYSTVWANQARSAYSENVIHMLVGTSGEPRRLRQFERRYSQKIDKLIDALGSGDIPYGVDQRKLKSLMDCYRSGEYRATDFSREIRSSIAHRYYAEEYNQGRDDILSKLKYDLMPEFRKSTIKRYCLDHPYVESRLKAIASIVIETPEDKLKESDIADLLFHKTTRTEKTEKFEREVLSRRQIRRVACDWGSHWTLKRKYRNDPDGWKYDLSDYYSGKGSRSRTVVETNIFTEYHDRNDATINSLEKEIVDYVSERNGSLSHTIPVVRAYTNLRWIAEENPGRQLDIIPGGI